MTAPTLTYLVARERINDLVRQAERGRRAADLSAPHRVKRFASQLFAGRVAVTTPACLPADRI